MSERPVLIVNPRSGGGMATQRWAKLVGPITDGLGPFDTLFTERAGHAHELALREATDGRGLVVAVGGDGTISEVAGGVLEAGGRAALGVIPRGTGGDFRRALDIPHDVGEAARMIGLAAVRIIDAGRVTYSTDDGPRTRWFVNEASFGFSSVVAARANGSSKRLGAKVAFLGALGRSLFTYENVEVNVTVDGAAPRRMTLLFAAFGNGRFFGGGMMVCPKAHLSDGFLDMVSVSDLGVSQFLTRIMPRAYNGTHLELEEVESAQVRVVEVEPVDPQARIPIELDGETPGHLPARFEVVPGALKLRW
jgi:diacylglycerol kinase (ATP)